MKWTNLEFLIGFLIFAVILGFCSGRGDEALTGNPEWSSAEPSHEPTTRFDVGSCSYVINIPAPKACEHVRCWDEIDRLKERVSQLEAFLSTLRDREYPQPCPPTSESVSEVDESSFPDSSDPESHVNKHGTIWPPPSVVVPMEPTIPPFREEDATSRGKPNAADTFLSNQTTVSLGGRDPEIDSERYNTTAAKKPSTITGTNTNSAGYDDEEDIDIGGEVTVTIGGTINGGVETRTVEDGQRTGPVTARPGDENTNEGLDNGKDTSRRTSGRTTLTGASVTARPADKHTKGDLTNSQDTAGMTRGVSGGTSGTSVTAQPLEKHTEEDLTRSEDTTGISHGVPGGISGIYVTAQLLDKHTEEDLTRSESTAGRTHGEPGRTPGISVTVRPPDEIASRGSEYSSVNNQPTTGNGVSVRQETVNNHFDRTPTEPNLGTSSVNTQGQGVVDVGSVVSDSITRGETVTPDIDDIVGPSGHVDDNQESNNNGNNKLPPTDKTKSEESSVTSGTGSTRKASMEDSVTERPSADRTTNADSQPQITTTTRDNGDRLLLPELDGKTEDQATDNEVPGPASTYETEREDIVAITESSRTRKTHVQGSATGTSTKEQTPTHGTVTHVDRDIDVSVDRGTGDAEDSRSSTDGPSSPDVHVITNSGASSTVIDRGSGIQIDATEAMLKGGTPAGGINIIEIDVQANTSRTRLPRPGQTIPTVTSHYETVTRVIPPDRIVVTEKTVIDNNVVNPLPTGKTNSEVIDSITKPTASKQSVELEPDSNPVAPTSIAGTKEATQQSRPVQTGTKRGIGVQIDSRLTESTKKVMHHSTVTQISNSNSDVEYDNSIDSDEGWSIFPSETEGGGIFSSEKEGGNIFSSSASQDQRVTGSSPVFASLGPTEESRTNLNSKRTVVSGVTSKSDRPLTTHAKHTDGSKVFEPHTRTEFSTDTKGVTHTITAPEIAEAPTNNPTLTENIGASSSIIFFSSTTEYSEEPAVGKVESSHTTPTEAEAEDVTLEKTAEPETVVVGKQDKKPRKFRHMTSNFGHQEKLKKPKWKLFKERLGLNQYNYTGEEKRPHPKGMGKPNDCVIDGCLCLRKLGHVKDGVYYMKNPEGSGRRGKHIRLYCDMATDGGGWTVLQRRQNGTTNFYRKWDHYAKGFGYLDSDFWLGNNVLHALTSQTEYMLRVEFTDWDDKKGYAEYSGFRITDESDNFRLILGHFIGDGGGNVGDALSYHNGSRFSTRDRDNDKSSGSCAFLRQAGFWFRSCNKANPNGRWIGRPEARGLNGAVVAWGTWEGHGYTYCLKTFRMMIRSQNLLSALTAGASQRTADPDHNQHHRHHLVPRGHHLHRDHSATRN